MPDVERALRQQARVRIEAGQLPRTRPDGTWCEPGSGTACAVCDVDIGTDDSELEVDFLPDTGNVTMTLRFHLACFAAWELERGLLLRASAE
jgi:hypothetical protein